MLLFFVLPQCVLFFFDWFDINFYDTVWLTGWMMSTFFFLFVLHKNWEKFWFLALKLLFSNLHKISLKSSWLFHLLVFWKIIIIIIIFSLFSVCSIIYMVFFSLFWLKKIKLYDLSVKKFSFEKENCYSLKIFFQS